MGFSELLKITEKIVLEDTSKGEKAVVHVSFVLSGTTLGDYEEVSSGLVKRMLQMQFDSSTEEAQDEYYGIDTHIKKLKIIKKPSKKGVVLAVEFDLVGTSLGEDEDLVGGEGIIQRMLEMEFTKEADDKYDGIDTKITKLRTNWISNG